MERRSFLKHTGSLVATPALPAVAAISASIGRIIPLFEFDIFGLRNFAQAEALGQLRPGTALSLRRSLKNATDVEVCCDALKIGELPRSAAHAIAQLLDRGLSLTVIARPVTDAVHHRGPVRLDIGLRVDEPTRPEPPSAKDHFAAAESLLQEAATARSRQPVYRKINSLLHTALLAGARGWFAHHDGDSLIVIDDREVLQMMKRRLPVPIAHRWHAAELELHERDWEKETVNDVRNPERDFERRHRARESLNRLDLRRFDHVWAALALAGHTCGFDFPDRQGCTYRMQHRTSVPELGEPDAAQRRRLMAILGFFCRTMEHIDREKISYVLYELEEKMFRERGNGLTGIDFHAWRRGPIATALREEWDHPEPDLAACIAEIDLPRRSPYNEEAQPDAAALSEWERAVVHAVWNGASAATTVRLRPTHLP